MSPSITQYDPRTSKGKIVMAEGPRVRDVAELVDVSSLLTEDERAVQLGIRKFLDEQFRPYIAEWYEAGIFPRELVPELAKLDLFGMQISGYGCAGLGPVGYGLACLELEAADSGLRSFISVQSSLVMTAVNTLGSDEQKAHWLPKLHSGEALGCFGLTEPDHGSDPASMKTRAVRDGSDWVINGSKMWITNGSIADVAVVWARTDEGVQGFLVPTDTSGFSAQDMHGKLSMRASITSTLAFDSMRVPDDTRLPEARGLRAALSCLNEARFGIIFGSMGAARDCLQSARDYALSREQFGRPIGGFQLTQAKLADMAVELNKGLLLAIHLGRMKQSGTITPEAVSTGKLNNVREALKIARTSRTIFGAAGILAEYPVLRHANNLESVLTYEGTAEVHQLVIGEAMTGLAAYRG